MIMIEMRQAAKDKAFDLLDEIKDLGRQKKMALCKLEETLYECFESSEEDEEEYENSDYSSDDNNDEEMDYRSRRSYRGRRNMRSMRDGAFEDEDMDPMRKSHHAMRMRRNRMGRFV